MSILGQVFIYMLAVYAIGLPAFYLYCKLMDKHWLGGRKAYPARTAASKLREPWHRLDEELILAAGF